MDRMNCLKCGGTYIEKSGNYVLIDPYVGKIIVHGVTYYRCDKCKDVLYSEAMAQHGYDPMPTFHEPVESLVSRPDLAKEYPLILITGPRTIFFTNSRYRNLPTLRKLCTAPLIEINPETARSIGIADGDMVRVNTVRGSIAIEARLTEDIHPRVVSMLHGWSSDTGANANYLTDNSAVDPVSSFPEHKSILCRIMKA